MVAVELSRYGLRLHRRGPADGTARLQSGNQSRRAAAPRRLKQHDSPRSLRFAAKEGLHARYAGGSAEGRRLRVRSRCAVEAGRDAPRAMDRGARTEIPRRSRETLPGARRDMFVIELIYKA